MPGVITVEDVAVGGDRRDRVEPAAQRLAEDVDVGHDVLVVAGERAAGAGQAGLDLVGDHQHLGAVAQRADLLEVALRRDDHAALALDRLEQDGDGGLVDGGLERLEVAVRHEPEAGGVRRVAGRRDRVGRERHDRRGAAVEVALHRDDGGVVLGDALDQVAPLAAHLDRGLDGLGAGVHRQDHLLAGELGQVARERPELVVVERPAGQRQPAELLVGAGHQARVAVAEVEGGVARQAVEVAAARRRRSPRRPRRSRGPRAAGGSCARRRPR